jgi:hypothetical protein
VFVVAQPHLQKARRLIIVSVLFWRFFVDVVQSIVQSLVFVKFIVSHILATD